MLVSKGADVTARMVTSVTGGSTNMEYLIKPLIRGEFASLQEMHFPRGAATSVQDNENEFLVYVVRGRLKTTIGQETHSLGPGDSCRFPKGVLHSLEAIEELIYLEVKCMGPDPRSA
jgi:quercetin dioxygenase-like cupin family protein